MNRSTEMFTHPKILIFIIHSMTPQSLMSLQSFWMVYLVLQLCYVMNC